MDTFRKMEETPVPRRLKVDLYRGDKGRPRLMTKDVTQEVFLKLMTRISQFENRSEFSTWLYRLVTNTCLDRKRALRRFLSFGGSRDNELPGRAPSSEEKYIRREAEVSIRKAIAGMRPKLRITVLLKYFDDLSYDEIAEVLGCSKGTVASRLNRAHRILARKLSHLREAFPLREGSL